MFCSELVASVLKESKVPGTELWEPANMTPEDILRFVIMSVAFKE
jgi:hypothetical protein